MYTNHILCSQMGFVVAKEWLVLFIVALSDIHLLHFELGCSKCMIQLMFSVECVHVTKNNTSYHDTPSTLTNINCQ